MDMVRRAGIVVLTSVPFGHGNIQNDLVLTFGLGAACDIDKIEVRWPDSTGSTQTFTGVVSNYDVTLKQGQATPEYH